MKEIPFGVKILLLLLLIAVIYFSAAGLALLACELSCAGYKVMGTIVFLGGFTGVIALVLWAVRRLFFKKKIDKKTDLETNGNTEEHPQGDAEPITE